MRRADPRQFDMFAAIEPPKPVGPSLYEQRQAALAAMQPANMIGRDQHGRPLIKTRAASDDGIVTICDPDSPEPIEVVVRGIPTVISFHVGFCTHVIDGPGSPYWSETGFRSFTGYYKADPAWIIEQIEQFIAAPAKHGKGCGGKLTRWWPFYVETWRQSLAFELMYCKDRSTVWDQWGEDEWLARWEAHDRKLAESMEQMRAAGIDPNEIGPPSFFKGKWPTFGRALL